MSLFDVVMQWFSFLDNYPKFRAICPLLAVLGYITALVLYTMNTRYIRLYDRSENEKKYVRAERGLKVFPVISVIDAVLWLCVLYYIS